MSDKSQLPVGELALTRRHQGPAWPGFGRTPRLVQSRIGAGQKGDGVVGVAGQAAEVAGDLGGAGQV
jgi:hypothetical protein